MENPYEQFVGEKPNPYEQFVPQRSLDVDTSPIELPPPKEKRTIGSEHGWMPPFTHTPDSYTSAEREAAARGVDINSELKDTELRGAIGFSPNESFTADFLAKKISEKTGFPAEEVVRFGPSGNIEFYNAETKRFTPLDGRNLSMGDLADLYGPVQSITPAVVGGVGGLIVGGPYVSAGTGAGGAWVGEMARLHRGKNMGVHDLSNEEIFNLSMKAAGYDAAFGVGFIWGTELKRLYRKFRFPDGMTAEEARDILYSSGKHTNDVHAINEILEEGRRAQQFKLDPVVGHPLGEELRDAAARTSNASKALREGEIAANTSSLDEVAKIVNRIDVPEGTILSDEGAEAVGRTAQKGLRDEKDRLQAHFDDQYRAAEDEMMTFLDDLGHAEKGSILTTGGQRARTILAAHQDELVSRRKAAWKTYQETIGQKIPGDEGFTEAVRYQSKVQVPITKEIAEHHNVVLAAREESLLSGKATGKGALKGTQPTTTETSESLIIGLDGKPAVTGSVTKQNHIDLAVLDDDIKEVRDLIRRGTEGFSSRKLKLAERQLTKLRNDYLTKNNPTAMSALSEAEKNTITEKTFVNKSVYAKVLKAGVDGEYVLDDVGVFRAIFQDKSGRAMKELVGIARQNPGGEFGLQSAALQFYKANATKRGSNVILKAAHDKFVSENSEVLKVLFPDQTMIKFGNFEKAVTRLGKKAERVRKVLNASPLGKLGSGSPEKMGKRVFAEGISQKHVRQVMAVLSPEQNAAFKESVGRHIYNRISKDGGLSTKAISDVIQDGAGKLHIIFGDTYVRDLQTLRRMIHANLSTHGNKELSMTTMIGRFARILNPPLTARGRVQSWFEKLRINHANEVLNRAVRDENVLRGLVRQGEMDIRNPRVMSFLGQIGGLYIAYDDPTSGVPGQFFNTLPRDDTSQPPR